MKFFKYRIVNHILFWIFIFTFYTLPFVLSYGLSKESFVNVLYIPVDIVTVYIVIEFLMPRYLFKNRNILLFAGGTFLALILNIVVAYYIKYNLQGALGFWDPPRRAIVSEVFYALLTNFMIVGTASALKLFSYSYNIQLTKSELERKTVQSELGILRSQVNPHFLFNVLNNIDALIFEDKEKASNAIFLLSKIMRYMLHESPHEQVLLDKEISYIEDYLELAKLSFADPRFLEFKSSGSLAGKKIPPLLFIPLIENAIKHCNKKAKIPGVKIRFNVEKDFIEMRTSNYIKSNKIKLPGNKTGGTGIKNVEKRLKLLHGKNYTLNISQDADKFELYLKIPLS